MMSYKVFVFHNYIQKEMSILIRKYTNSKEISYRFPYNDTCKADNPAKRSWLLSEVAAMNAILTSSDRCNTSRFSANRNKEHENEVKVKLIVGDIYTNRRWNLPLLVFILISLASSRSKFACTPSQATSIFCRHSVANTLVGHLLMNKYHS